MGFLTISALSYSTYFYLFQKAVNICPHFLFPLVTQLTLRTYVKWFFFYFPLCCKCCLVLTFISLYNGFLKSRCFFQLMDYPNLKSINISFIYIISEIRAQELIYPVRLTSSFFLRFHFTSESLKILHLFTNDHTSFNMIIPAKWISLKCNAVTYVRTEQQLLLLLV